MRTLFSRAIQIDPSFHAALGVIVILAIAEVFFATSYYVGRARANRVSAQAITATIARAPAASTPSARAPLLAHALDTMPALERAGASAAWDGTSMGSPAVASRHRVANRDVRVSRGSE